MQDNDCYTWLRQVIYVIYTLFRIKAAQLDNKREREKKKYTHILYS